jgi:hypothetical protein
MESARRKLAADARLLAEERKKVASPPKTPGELPLTKPTKPGKTPDVVPLGGKP